MMSSISENTMNQYSPAIIVAWAKYCKPRNIIVTKPSITEVTQYLTRRFHEGVSYGSLNSTRSALALIIGSHLGTDDKVKRLFRGFFKLRPPKPKYYNTWEVSGLLNYIENNYIQHNDLKMATKKAVTLLLMLATGQRAQTISFINTNNIVIKEDCIMIKIEKLINTSGPNRCQPFLTVPFFHTRIGVCPASAVVTYLE